MKYGELASDFGYHLPLKVLKSGAGYYIGTSDRGSPVSRESAEYYRTEAEAQYALDNNTFTQRDHP